MAENIVAGLFGMTPESYQGQQYQQDLKRSYELAQLDPGAAARAQLGASVGQLGRGFAGAMGIEDPQLKLISTRNSIAQQIDQTDPESILKGAQMLAQAGDQQGAFALAEYARKAQSEMALAQQRLREKAAADPFQQLLRTGKYTPESLAEFQRTGKPEDLMLFEKTEKPAKTSYGAEADRASKARFGKNFDELTQAEAAVIDTLLEERGVKKAKEGASKLVLPGEKALVDIPAFTRNVQQTIEKPLNAIFQVDNALANIGDAIKTDNFASYRAAQTQFAKAIAGAGDLSQKELKAAGADPALIGGAADYLSTLASSTPTRDTMEKMQKAMQTIKKVNTNKANAELERQRKIAIAAGYPVEAVNMALSFPELATAPEGKKTNTRTLKSGKVVTVVEE
jgi:hypothetical protein